MLLSGRKGAGANTFLCNLERLSGMKIECDYKNGQIESLKVSPAYRIDDIVVLLNGYAKK